MDPKLPLMPVNRGICGFLGSNSAIMRNAAVQPAFCLFRKTLNNVAAHSPCAADLHLRVRLKVYSVTQ